MLLWKVASAWKHGTEYACRRLPISRLEKGFGTFVDSPEAWLYEGVSCCKRQNRESRQGTWDKKRRPEASGQPLAFCFPLFLSWCFRSPFLVSCSLPAFCALPFAFRWSWPCASFLELLPLLLPAARRGPPSSFHIALYYIMYHCITYHLICCSSSFLRPVVASWFVCVSGCAPDPCPLCVPWLPPLRLPCLFWSIYHPLPFASLCSCPDASGLLFLSHVPCLLSLFCLLQHDTPSYNHASGLSTNVPNPFSNLLIGSLLLAYSVPCFHALATFLSNMSLSCD